MHLRRVVWAGLATVLLVAAACETGTSDPGFDPGQPVGRPTGSDALVVGLVATQSGPDSWRGEDAFEGADLALAELNRSQEAGESPFELVALDDSGDPERAVEQVTRLAELERTVGIVYAGPQEAIPEVEDTLVASGLPLMLIHGDLSRNAISRHVFQMAPPLGAQAGALARYLIDDRAYEDIGFIALRGGGGDVAVEFLERAVADRGGDRPRVVRPHGDSLTHVQEALDRLGSRQVEAVVVHGTPGLFNRVSAELVERGARYRHTRAARIASAGPRLRRTRRRDGYWRPQLLGFSGAINARGGADRIPGTVAAETYARGGYMLPVPEFERFTEAFEAWWESRPLGWEQRSYDAVHLIGWAVRRAGPEEDLVGVLEEADNLRFSGLPLSFSAEDHVAVAAPHVGLWVVPHEERRIRGQPKVPEAMPWVLLARSFASGQFATGIHEDHRAELFVGDPDPGAAPNFRRMRFAVTTDRSDPVH